MGRAVEVCDVTTVRPLTQAAPDLQWKWSFDCTRCLTLKAPPNRHQDPRFVERIVGTCTTATLSTCANKNRPARVARVRCIRRSDMKCRQWRPILLPQDSLGDKSVLRCSSKNWTPSARLRSFAARMRKSALGHKRLSRVREVASAVPPRAEIQRPNFRSWM